MISKNMHPARKIFRSILLVILGSSMFFFAAIVAMRVYYKDKPITGQMQARVFDADILQYQTRAYFSNDQEDMLIANKLIKLGFFSPKYSKAGLKMLHSKAQEGHPPAIEKLAYINTKKTNQ